MKLQFNIEGQNLQVYVPSVMVADTINYFEADFVFLGNDWNGLSKWAHFRQGEQVYDLPLTEDRIPAEAGLNLGSGCWEVCVHGECYENNRVSKRIVTDLARFTVETSGSLEGGDFPRPEIIAKLEPADDDLPRVYLSGTLPNNKEEGTLPMELEYRSKSDELHSFVSLAVQGSSSAEYPKKNYTIRLYTDGAHETNEAHAFRDWKPHHHFVLRANYLDHSQLRDWLGAQLWSEAAASRALPQELRASSNFGASDAFPVKLYVNGIYQGVYTWTIPKSAWQWNMDDENPNHALLCAEINSGSSLTETPCNFRALWNGVDGEAWSVIAGQNSETLKNSLNALISCIKDSDDETFKEHITDHLDVQSALDYFIHQYVICGVDGMAKNMLLATYDGTIWHCGANDMDRSFGIHWENGFASPTMDCPDQFEEPYSLLWERLEKLYPQELYERYCELRRTVYSIPNLFSKAERMDEWIGSELYAEEEEIWPNQYLKGQLTIQQMRDFICQRLTYCDEQFDVLGGKDKLLFSMEETVFDGNTYVDSGVKLFSKAQDFSVILDLTQGDLSESGRNQNILCCTGETGGYYGGLDLRTNPWGDGTIELYGMPNAGGSSFSGDIKSSQRLKLVLVFRKGLPEVVRYKVHGTEQVVDCSIWGDYSQPAIHDDSLYIGCHHVMENGQNSQFFHGTIHSCEIYGRALSYSELKDTLN